MCNCSCIQLNLSSIQLRFPPIEKQTLYTTLVFQIYLPKGSQADFEVLFLYTHYRYHFCTFVKLCACSSTMVLHLRSESMVGCALTFASEAKFEIEAKISFRLEGKKQPDFT